MPYGDLHDCDPASALALAIIEQAVEDWKADRASPAKRIELLAFFHGDWFNFLFMTAVRDIDKDMMFGALGIPPYSRQYTTDYLRRKGRK